MKGAWLFVLGALCGAVVMAAPRIVGHLHVALRGGNGGNGGTRVHTEEKFTFTAKGPMEKVAPLFGADKERVWSPGWNPQFVFPAPTADEEGMVFTVAHDHLRAAWVNTEFDLKNGRIQYVYVIPDALATVITLRLTPAGEQTQVEVEYDRTALSAEADAHVRHLADGDRRAGPEWEEQVNGFLEKVGGL
ncbi:MAG TPA: hypothetical protein VMU53_04590 [Candidatus Sulfotelmatobacter sp.]|nr:hypothetical protein [Candidatus Sulfotelmatobacter sp.]